MPRPVGGEFHFYYRTKIARDFVLSIPEVPHHVWEPQTTKLLLYLARGARNVIVGGAYFGDQAILIAKQLESKGICHAFEPSPEHSQMMVHNAKINNLSNVRVLQMALWSSSAERVRLLGNDAFASSETVQPRSNDPVVGSYQTFETITINDYLERRGIKKVDLIMLDLEGSEYRALQGASHQLGLPADSAPNIVFEIHRNYVDWTNGLKNTDIVEYLSSFGYEVYAVRDFHSNYDMSGKPIEIILPEETYLEGPPHGFNMVAVKDVSILQSDKFRICRGVSPKLLLHKDPVLHHPTNGL